MAAIEFQITVQRFQDIFEHQIKPHLSNTCTAWAIGNQIVDHLELSGPVQLVNSPGRVEASAPMDIYLVSQQELEASINMVRKPAMQTVPVSAVYDITISGLVITVSYRDVRLSVLEKLVPPDALQVIKTAIRTLMTPRAFSVNLAPKFAKIDPQNVLNITASAIATDGWVLTVRFELADSEGGNPGAALQVQPLPVRLDGQQAAIWVAGSTLETIAQSIVTSTVNSKLQGAETEVRWLPDGNTPRVRIIIRKGLKVPSPFSATAVVTVYVSFSMAPFGVIGGGSAIQISVDWDWDVEGDFVTEAVVGLAKMLGFGPEGVPLPEGAVRTGDKSFVIERAILAESFGPGTINFTRITVVDDGMALAGLVRLQSLPDLYPLEIARWRWFVGYIATCSGRAKDPTDRNRRVMASASFTVHNPGVVCDIIPVGIPDHIMSRYVTKPTGQPDPYIVTIVIPEAALRYLLQNYSGDFRFQVETSRGVRLISLGRPHVVYGEDGRVQNSEVRFINDCDFELIDPWARVFHTFNPKWLVDPSPEFWLRGMAGLPILEAVTIRAHGVSARLGLKTDGFGQQAISAIESDRFFTSFLMPVTAHNLTARMALEDTGGNGLPPTDIEIDNVLLQRVTSLPLDGPISGFAAGLFQDQPVLAAGLPDRAALYALHDLVEIPLIAEFDAPAATDFILANEWVLAFGQFGLVAFDGYGTDIWVEEPVLGVQQLSGSSLFAVLTENGVAVCEPGGHIINFMEAPGARAFIVSGNWLLLAFADYLESFSIDGTELFSWAVSELQGIAALSTVPSALGAGVIAAVLEDESARFFDVFNNGEIGFVAELESHPWFAGVAMFNDLAVFSDEPTQSLVLYSQ